MFSSKTREATYLLGYKSINPNLHREDTFYFVRVREAENTSLPRATQSSSKYLWAYLSSSSYGSSNRNKFEVQRSKSSLSHLRAWPVVGETGQIGALMNASWTSFRSRLAPLFFASCCSASVASPVLIGLPPMERRSCSTKRRLRSLYNTMLSCTK